MKRHLPFTMLILISISVFTGCKSVDNEITMKSLVEEMTSIDAIARWPEPGYKCLQASSYNRESVSPDKPGWFADSDGIGYIRTEEKDGHTEWVLMEDEGPGCITRIWTPCFYYSLNNTKGVNIKFYLDGSDTAVINTNFFRLVKGQDFIGRPFADSTARAGVMIFPIPYSRSCKITMDGKAFYNIINYRKYPEGTIVKTFTMKDYNDLGKELEKAANKLTIHKDPRGNLSRNNNILKPGEEMVIDLPEGSMAIRQLEIKINTEGNYAESIRSVVLIAEFDGEETVWAPAGDFFSNVGKLRPYDMFYRSVNKDSSMVSRWVMPYRTKASVRLKNFGQSAVTAELKVITSKWKWDEKSMYFHATWRMDEPYPTFPIFDWNFLEAEGRGVIAGDEWTVLNPAEGWWGEGDEKIWVDDDFENRFPSHFGTGTEDYYGWAGGVVPTPENEFAKPFHGNIIVGDPRSMGYNLSTRTRSLDAIPFTQKIKFDMEASCGIRSSSFFLQYAQTTFWYAFPGVKHNRKPLPEMAGQPLPTLEKLQQQVAEARSRQYSVDGAVEAEILKLSAKSSGVKESGEKIDVWGEISNGDLKKLLFEKAGDYAEIKITEQFKKADLRLCATVGPASGIFDIYVNGTRKVTQNFNTGHSGMTTPLIELGETEPLDNAFNVRFEYKGKGTQAKPGDEKSVLGLDYFLVKKN